jgi:hypothetical protein
VNHYDYSPDVVEQLNRALRDALPSGTPIKAQPEADFGGVDYIFTTRARIPIAVRCRFDRPFNAQDRDVTFRSTEPAMIAAGTYAPLELFAWFQHHRLIAGRVVDIYRMAARIRPPLQKRPITGNHDGTGFITVSMGELVDADALLRTGDLKGGWGTACTGGMRRIEHILATWQSAYRGDRST